MEGVGREGSSLARGRWTGGRKGVVEAPKEKGRWPYFALPL